MSQSPQFISEKDVSRLLAVSVVALQQWRYRGKGPPYRKFGRSVKYVLAEVLAWADAQAVGIPGGAR